MADDTPLAGSSIPASEPVISGPVQGESATVNAPTDHIRESMETAYSAIENRAPNGQFIRKDTARLPDESALRNHEAPPAAEKPPAEAEPGEPIEMPRAWGKALSAYWNDLPYPVQQEFFRREDEIQKFVSENGRVLKQAETSQQELNGIFERFRDTIPKGPGGREIPRHTLIEQLMAANDILERNPREALAWLAHSKGIDLSELAAEIAQRSADPIETARQQERAAIQAELQRRDAAMQEQLQLQQQMQRAAYMQELEQQIEQFAAARPYFGELQAEIEENIAGIKYANPSMPPLQALELATTKALANRPDLDPKAKQTKAQELAERKQRAEQARRIASMNVGTSKVGVSPVRQHNISQGRGLEMAMEEIWDRINS
jgi:hypothetical protein